MVILLKIEMKERIYRKKIEKVINDSKLRNELGIEAKNKANEFSKEKIVNIWGKKF